MSKLIFSVLCFIIFYFISVNICFAASCSYNECNYNDGANTHTSSVETFDCQSDLLSAWQAGKPSNVVNENYVFAGNPWVNGCMGVPSGISPSWYGNNGSTSWTFYFLCPTTCDFCPASQQCGGPQEYIVLDESACTWKCKCTSERAQASQQCGGDDKYTINEQTCEYQCVGTPGTCPTGCETVCQQKSSECGGIGYYFTDASNCIAECNPSQPCPSGCEGICDSMVGRCGDPGYVFTDEANCIAECKNPNCGQLVIDRCGNIENVTWDNVDTCDFHCTHCNDSYEQAKQDCPHGFDFYDNNSCSYKCKDCNQLARECGDRCYGDDSYAVNQCSETDGVVTENLCQCRTSGSGSGGTDPSEPDPGDNPPQTCDEARSRCNAACSFICSADDPASSVCDCSRNPDPEVPDNPDPSDSSDTNGWLGGIKGELEEANGWLEAIKHNTDDANDLQKEANDDLDNIAENMRRSVDNQGKLQKTSEEGNKLLADIKNAIDGIDVSSSSSASGFAANISTSVEGVEDLGTTGDITGSGYVPDANPANIPLPESTSGDFGTFTPSQESTYIDEAKSRISGMGFSLSNSTCQETVSFSGVGTWNLNFCPYADFFSKIGSLLVMLVALRELLNFA